MLYTRENYSKNLEYVGAIFTLGGLSECGKTTAGYRFQALGVRKSKIIHIEYDMMRARGINPDNGVTPDTFEDLYRSEPQAAYEEFLFRFIEKMKADNTRFASLESLYRAPLGAFIKHELGPRAANIYIDAPLEDRAYREYLKVNQKAREAGSSEISLDEMIAKVQEKDKFKTERRATDVRDIADFVVDNSRNVTLDQFLSQIDSIAYKMGVSPQADSRPAGAIPSINSSPSRMP